VAEMTSCSWRRVERGVGLVGLTLLVALSGCSRSMAQPEASIATPDPVTRLVSREPQALLHAAVAAMRDMGFQIPDPAAGESRIYSGPLVVQTSWMGEPVSERILCGIGTAAASDPFRVAQLANTIPIELSLGYEVEPRPGATATRLIFLAQGRRGGSTLLTTPMMSCTLTHAFVDEMFTAIEAQFPSPE